MVELFQPLRPHQDPFFYSITITAIFLILMVYNISTNSSNILWTSIVFIIGLISSFLIYDNRCPKCKRPFSKQEQRELKEKLREETKPYIYYDKIQYLYSDGTPKNIVNDKQHSINEHWETNRHHYKCKKCNYTWTKVKEVNLDLNNRPKPYIKTIQTKEKNPLSNLADSINKNPLNKNIFTDYSNENTKEISKTPPLTKVETEKIIKQVGYKCQYPGCQERYSLHVHHIVKRSNNGTNKRSNLIVLCPTHHQKADRGEIPATRLKILNSKN